MGKGYGRKVVLVFGCLLCMALFLTVKIYQKEDLPVPGQSDSQYEGTKTEQGKDDLTVLKWAVFNIDINLSVFQDAVNDKMKEKGMPYEIEFVHFQMDYEKNYVSNLNAYIDVLEEEQVDFIHCPGGWGAYDIYAMMIQKGILQPLDSYMNETETGKCLYESYPASIWETMKAGGSIYGVLTPYVNTSYYAVMNKTYSLKYQVNEGPMVMEELKAKLLEAKEGERKAGNPDFAAGIFIPYVHFAEGYEYTSCDLIEIDTNQDVRAVNILQEQKYVEWLTQMNQLYLQGAVDFSDDYVDKLQAGNFMMIGAYSYSKDAAVRMIRERYDIPEEVALCAAEIPECDNPLNGTGTKNAVYAKSIHKDAAMEVLASIYSDPELSDALVYGKENISYTKENGFLLYTENYDGYGSIMQNDFGNIFLTSPNMADSVDKKKELWDTVENARLSGLSGFYFHMDKIGERIQQINSLLLESQLLYGKTNDLEGDLKKLREEVNRMGIDQVVEEMNRQMKP